MERKKRKSTKGQVISKKADKTVVVIVERKFAHPKFKKVVVSSKKFLVDDSNNLAKVGDFVVIEETRPISKRKYHRIVSVVGQAKVHNKELPKMKALKEEKESDTATV